MKILLIISAVLNIALGATFWFVMENAPEPSTPPMTPPPAPRFERKAPRQTSTPGTNDVSVVATASQKFDWRSVESEDYKKYIANLRSIGCPEETIRDIITADVNKLFDSRAKAERGSTNKFEYWKSGNPFANLFNEQTVAKAQERAKEKRDLLKELLGTDVQDKPDLTGGAMQIFETMLDFMPAEKQTQMVELEQKFAAKMMDAAKSAMKGDMTAMRTLQKEKDAEMLKFLSPEEKFEYDLRMSQSSMMMRMQLGDFELNEQEFRDIFKLRKAIDDEYGIMGMGGPLSKADQEKRDAAQKDMNDQIKEILGSRYGEYKYEAGGEWAAQQLHRISRENNVSRENAMKAYEITDTARVEADKVKRDASMSQDQKNAAYKAMHDETYAAITQVLGPDAAKLYDDRVSIIPGYAKPKK